MKRTMLGRIMVVLVGLLMATAFIACDDDPEPVADTGQDMVDDTVADMVDDTVADTEEDAADMYENPRVTACREAIETLAAQEEDEVADWPIDDAPEMIAAAGGDQALEADYAGHYRDDLATHPGCVARTEYGANTSEPFVTDNEATVPAGVPVTITGYDCAGKEYTQDNEDTSLPIVILVHGNSSGVTSFEEYENADLAGTELTNLGGFTFTVDASVRNSLATELIDAGYRVIAFDARVDRVATLTDWDSDATTGNPFLNIDHGWNVPMLQSLIKSVMTENPGRMFAVIGHSLGVTTIRDALRRLYVEWRNGDEGAINPYRQLSDVIFASGANHGVNSGDLLCLGYAHMKGKVGCEMGDRDAFTSTYFSERINGPSDLFSAPCADGSYAFGEADQCDGNVVQYTTITMEDITEGQLQDEFISEASSRLDLEPCVENVLIGLDDYDASAYFLTIYPGFYANHFGSVRSDDGISTILDRLAD